MLAVTEVPQAVTARMWYMCDCAPAHVSRAVWHVLCNMYHDRWTGRGGPTAWLPRSMPNFNPLDFYLWGHLCMQVLLAMKRHLTIALWMPVRLSTTDPESLNEGCCPCWDVSRHTLNLMVAILSTYFKCTFCLLSVCGTSAQVVSTTFNYTIYQPLQIAARHQILADILKTIVRPSYTTRPSALHWEDSIESTHLCLLLTSAWRMNWKGFGRKWVMAYS
jgi:hypothetical protein